MKKLLTTAMILGSTIALGACSNTYSEADLDGSLTAAPYAEERTVGASPAPMKRKAPVMRSAEPVFQTKQVK